MQYANGLGLKANFAITANQVDLNATWLTSAQMSAIYAAGNDFCTHGQHGALGVATNGANAVLDDILFNRDFLEVRGYTRASRFYVYPNGVYQQFAGDRWILDQLKIAGMVTLSARHYVTDNDAAQGGEPESFPVAAYWNAGGSVIDPGLQCWPMSSY